MCLKNKGSTGFTVVRTMINMIKHYESLCKSCKHCVGLYHLQLKLYTDFFLNVLY